MTPKQKRFVEEYLIDLNATQAAIRAGYSPKTANEQGARLLANVSIQSAITGLLEALSSAKIANVQEIMEYLTAVMRGEHTEEIPLLCGGGMQTLTPKGIGTKERLKAAELLGKRYGLFTDRVGIDGAVPIVIHDDIPED